MGAADSGDPVDRLGPRPGWAVGPSSAPGREGFWRHRTTVRRFAGFGSPELGAKFRRAQLAWLTLDMLNPPTRTAGICVRVK